MATKLDTILQAKYVDQDTEIAVAAYVLRRNPKYTVNPKCFASRPLAAMVRLVQMKGTPLSEKALLRELRLLNSFHKNEAVYVALASEVYGVDLEEYSKDNAEVDADSLRHMHSVRSTIYAMRDVFSDLRHDRFDLEKAHRKLVEVTKPSVNGRMVDSMDYLETHEAREKALEERSAHSGIPTGIVSFDQQTGGLMRAEFGVVAGAPGSGKSAMLVFFAVNAWRDDRNTVIVTGEMPKLDFAYRIDSMLADIPAQNFRLGNLSDRQRKRWASTIARERGQRQAFLEIVSFPRRFTTRDVEEAVLRLQDQHGKLCDLICIDYLNIMGAAAESTKSWEAQAETVWEVKGLTADLNDGIGLWTAGQLTDQGIQSDQLSLEHLKYSRAISETAPVVVGLMNTEKRQDVDHVLEMQVLKMRNAPLPKKAIILRPNFSFMRIHEEITEVSDLRYLDEGRVTAKRKEKSNARVRS